MLKNDIFLLGRIIFAYGRHLRKVNPGPNGPRIGPNGPYSEIYRQNSKNP